ncbi:MAG: thioredoxin domain-containing protein [candidate division Zixibacteria bacterium]|nr:thioredoxin domain-containing protein [candidate division Zixibacteria bacterium]
MKRYSRKQWKKAGFFVLSTILLLLVGGVFLLKRNGVSQERGIAEGGRKPIPPAEVLEKLPADGGPAYNRLVFEKSPYLLQHAGNPVDWYPWGEEAFAKARKEDKPIFLSIGYSTCHWCHVMEKESFEDEEVAKLLNRDFVSIKVDREERPDVDNIYMTASQVLTRGGGWPLTIVMTPDKKPFFAATYIPKEPRFGRPGMVEVIPGLAEAWKTRRGEIFQVAERVISALQDVSTARPGDELNRSTLDEAYKRFESIFDSGNAGFGSAPKFPTPHQYSFLLRYYSRTGNQKALEMTEKSLAAMRRGGICDQVGFGFHRYSTDPRWFLPHFEKMLYDQALLALAYLETYQATGKEEYARTAKEIFTYVLRDMTSPEGGFHSAEDADSEGEEGKFYLWTAEELKGTLGPDEAAFIMKIFNAAPEGNFRERETGRQANILHLTKPWGQLAREFQDLGVSSEQSLQNRWEAARQKLLEVRQKRIRPHKDDKILTDWNGLMIAALARGAVVLNEPQYAQAAGRAADFVLKTLRDDGRGRLLKRYRDGQAALDGQLDDYAFMVWGLIELYEATFEVRHLEEALKLNEAMLAHFWDKRNGGFYFQPDDGEKQIVRTREGADGALPSGNSVAAFNLLRLARMTGQTELEELASKLMKSFAGDVARSPANFTLFLTALDFALGPSFEVVIAGRSDGQDTRQMLAALRKPFLPNKVVLFRPEGAEEPPIAKLADFVRSQSALGGKATAYVCQNFVCSRPTAQVAQMLALLKERRPVQNQSEKK